MPKKEAQTDIWVHDLLKSEGITLEYQGCSIKEVNDALKTASKSGKGNAGFPEFCGVVNDFLVVIEDKADLTNHIYRDPKGLIDLSTEAVKNMPSTAPIITACTLPKTQPITKSLPSVLVAMKSTTASHLSLLMIEATRPSWTMSKLSYLSAKRI